MNDEELTIEQKMIFWRDYKIFRLTKQRNNWRRMAYLTLFLALVALYFVKYYK